MCQDARAVLLTSGTLCPTDSFSSELGTRFSICAELPHVIDTQTQVWAGVVTTGPGNISLEASFKCSSSFAFQDSVGKALAELCEVIPNGILCFFPSYRLMEILTERWRSTGQLDEILQLKPGGIFNEPSKVTNSELDIVIEQYCHGVGRGALFFGVCRGKVSEGIDFKDENARGVVVVGVPFPNIRDLQVDRKKQFNDSSHRLANGLLLGRDWYRLQASRAVNQSIGRCIRHRHDYGAVVLLDPRYGRSDMLNSLPKWLRSGVTSRGPLESHVAAQQLRGFFHGRPVPDPNVVRVPDPPASTVMTSSAWSGAIFAPFKKPRRRRPYGERGTPAVPLDDKLEHQLHHEEPTTCADKAVFKSLSVSPDGSTESIVESRTTLNLVETSLNADHDQQLESDDRE